EPIKIELMPFQNATPEQKDSLIRGFAQLTSQQALQLFMSLGLTTHFECIVVNEPTNEEFILSFKKSTQGRQDEKAVLPDLSQMYNEIFEDMNYRSTDIDSYEKCETKIELLKELAKQKIFSLNKIIE